MTGVSDFSAKVSRHVSQRLHTSIAPLTEANLYRHTVTVSLSLFSFSFFRGEKGIYLSPPCLAILTIVLALFLFSFLLSPLNRPARTPYPPFHLIFCQLPFFQALAIHTPLLLLFHFFYPLATQTWPMCPFITPSERQCNTSSKKRKEKKGDHWRCYVCLCLCLDACLMFDHYGIRQTDKQIDRDETRPIKAWHDHIRPLQGQCLSLSLLSLFIYTTYSLTHNQATESVWE